MSKEYKCLSCKHLKPKYDLLECSLQTVRYIDIDKSSWAYDPVCIHDAEVSSRKWYIANVLQQDVPQYDSDHKLTDRFEQCGACNGHGVVSRHSQDGSWDDAECPDCGVE